jgi:hypothetical protein
MTDWITHISNRLYPVPSIGLDIASVLSSGTDTEAERVELVLDDAALAISL